MQDRFRFRTWVKPTEIEIGYYTYFDIYDVAYIDDETNIILQSTGLKDKNGKLIYEGDIVKIFHVTSSMQAGTYIGAIIYDEKYCAFMIQDFGFLKRDDLIEVIGNIYENPELLTKEVQA